MADSWQFWAVVSAMFAALTAIFAKVGIENINSDFATLIRTFVIIGALCVFLTVSGQWQGLSAISTKTWTFLILSGLATGASWLAYLAPIDKLSIVMVAIFGVAFLGEKLSGLNWLGVLLIAGGVILLSLRF
jgi:bacterial/archaeal transporter family protein